MTAFSPENPKWDQNPKFAPLSETTSIPTPFILGVPPPPGADWRVPSKDTRNNYGFSRTLFLLFLKWRIAHFLATTKTTEVISFRRQLKTDLASHPLHYFTNNSLVHLVTKMQLKLQIESVRPHIQGYPLTPRRRHRALFLMVFVSVSQLWATIFVLTTVKLRFTDTRLIPNLVTIYYGQFALSLRKENLYTSLNSTRLTRTPR